MKKVVIIGGGIAGLSAGIYARKSGYDVDIYEKNPIAGGQCMGWNRKKHHIDNCIQWLTGTHKNSTLRKLWEDIGALTSDTQFVENDKFYTSIIDGKCLTLWRDIDKTRKELLQLSPEDEHEINKLLDHVEYAACCQMPVEKPMDMLNVIDYIKLGKSMRNMPKVLKEYGKINMVDLADRFRHPLLKILLTDYMPKEYQASAFLVSYASVSSGNGEIPVGGSLAMANRIKDKFLNLGGRLYCNNAVKKILIENNKAVGIELKNAETVTADYVISATDTLEMFDKLLGRNYMNKAWSACYNDEKSYPLSSGFQVAFSIDRDFYPYKDTIIVDCNPFEINKNKFDRMSLKSFQNEKKFAPEGKTVLQTNVIQYDEDYRYWKGLTEEEYIHKKQELAEIIKNRIVERFPELFGHIDLLDCWTPLTYERYCNSYHGAFMSFIIKKDIKSFQEKGIVEGLTNVFIASQWIMAPGGLPVAAAAGKFAVQRILKKEKRSYKI